MSASALTDILVENKATVTGLIAVPSTTATTLNGTLTLTHLSADAQVLSGSATGFKIALPDATTLAPGQKYDIYNQSTQPVSIVDGSGAVISTLGALANAYLYLQANSTAAGGWITWQVYAGFSGLQNYSVVSTTSFTTSSTTDVLITGFTVTPGAGTYAIWYSATFTQASQNARATCSVYRGGSVVTDSTRTVTTGTANSANTQTTKTVVQFTGSQACDMRVNTTATSLSVTNRSLILIRLGV